MNIIIFQAGLGVFYLAVLIAGLIGLKFARRGQTEYPRACAYASAGFLAILLYVLLDLGFSAWVILTDAPPAQVAELSIYQALFGRLLLALGVLAIARAVFADRRNRIAHAQ